MAVMWYSYTRPELLQSIQSCYKSVTKYSFDIHNNAKIKMKFLYIHLYHYANARMHNGSLSQVLIKRLSIDSDTDFVHQRIIVNLIV